MENNELFLIQNKNPPQNQNKPENINCNTKYSDQNKNLNESMITTSTSSVSVNNKKNVQHTNYKTPKKKNFQIPMPKPKNNKQQNSKNPEKMTKNQNTINNIIYTKGTIKKPNNNNINDTNNKLYGRSMSQISIDQDNNKKNQNNNIPVNNNKTQIYSQLDINQNHQNQKQNLKIKNKNQSALNRKKLNIINEAINKDISNEVNYFSNNEDDNNNIINNTINHNDNKIIPNDISKKMPTLHRTILKEYDNKFSTGYYSESDQRKEKSAVLNIEEILMTEEKLSAVISCIQNGTTCEEECFDWFNSYYHTALSNNIEKYFIKDEYIKIIRRAVNLNVFSLMLCYDISYNPPIFNECLYKLNEIMSYNHTILILISKYFSNKIIDHNLWVIKLEQLINKYDPSLKNALRIVKEILYYSNILIKLIPEILAFYQNTDFLAIFHQLDILSSQGLYNIYREKIHRIINQNGSILASSSYFKNNKTNVNIPVPYIGNRSNKPYTLVLDLDETLIHFKANPNNEESGTIKIRPYLYQFLDKSLTKSLSIIIV